MALIFLIISNNEPQMSHPGSDGRRYLAQGLHCTGADGDHSRGRFRVSGVQKVLSCLASRSTIPTSCHLINQQIELTSLPVGAESDRNVCYSQNVDI